MAVIKKLEDYSDQFTLDNRLKPQPGVTREKVKHVKDLFEKARAGNRVAAAQMQELFSTSDASFSMAHLLNIQTLPMLTEATEEIDGLVGTRVTSSFDPIVLRQLLPLSNGQANDGVDGAGVGQYGEAAIVPEGTPYPIVTFQGDETAYYQKLAKRGFRFDFTFESWINDIVGELEQMPDRMLTVTKKTYLADYWEAINKVNNPVASVLLPDGTSTNANPRPSAMGIIAAVVDIENRKINNVKIGTLGSYIVLVPKGQKRFLEYDIAKFGRVIEVQDGALTLGPDSEMQALFPSIVIHESDRLTGTNWKIYPVPGSTPFPVIERLILRGYENPEIRVRSDQGFHPGGGQVGIFQGGFDADTASFRFRMVTGSAVWFDTYIANSTGANPVTS